jgi:hypothetical protein
VRRDEFAAARAGSARADVVGYSATEGERLAIDGMDKQTRVAVRVEKKEREEERILLYGLNSWAINI